MIQGDLFYWFRPKSVEDGKIPTEKVKVGLFNSKMLSFNSDFHFFGRDLPTSTLFEAEPVIKITLYKGEAMCVFLCVHCCVLKCNVMLCFFSVVV